MENNLESKSTKELEESLKGLKIISIALVIVIGLLLTFTIYGLLFKENNTPFMALLVVGISCAGILPIQFTTMKKIKAELKSRNI